MSNWKVMRVGLNLKIKSWAGLRYRPLVRKSVKMSTDEFWCYQEAAFRQIYEFARSRIPFYQKRPDFYPPIPVSHNALEFLSKLPLLKKQTVREYNSEFWPSPLLPLTKFHTTSGTTGTPLRLPATLWERGFLQAEFEEWLLHICGSRNPRALYLSGFMTPPLDSDELFWIDRLSGDVYLSIYSLNLFNREKIINLFESLHPRLIYGYASAVYQLANLLGDSAQNSKGERVVGVTSEVLQPHWRDTIEGFLCEKVFDYYGSQEKCHTAWQCVGGKMHIDPLIGIIEILGENDEAVKQGDTGRVVVTGLSCKSMPLIRYEIGDLAESTGYTSDCSCGLNWPTIGQIGGRTEDLIRTRDGRSVGMLAFAAFRNLNGIKEAQIIQKDYEKFICNIVKSEHEQVPEEYLERAIKAEITERLHLKNAHIAFEYLPSIPRGANGKFKAVTVDFEAS